MLILAILWIGAGIGAYWLYRSSYGSPFTNTDGLGMRLIFLAIWPALAIPELFRRLMP